MTISRVFGIVEDIGAVLVMILLAFILIPAAIKEGTDWVGHRYGHLIPSIAIC